MPQVISRGVQAGVRVVNPIRSPPVNAAPYPLFADLRDRSVLVVGSGATAERQVEALLQAGALPVVGAPRLSEGLTALRDEGRIGWRVGKFHADWLQDVWLAIAASDDAALNLQVAAAGEVHRVFVNAVGAAEPSRFLLPTPLPRLPQPQADDCPQPSPGDRQTRQHAGCVALVGAGPGDPGLLTLNALRALSEADVILHDRLVSDEVLQLSQPGATRIEVGKSAGRDSVGQGEIHALMLHHARQGRRVVRLKGGDPFVFGRGGEELEFLRAHGIGFEVVPGITAAVACAAYAGIPLTHRDHAQSLRLVTAHCKDSLDTLNWKSLAQEQQTLAVYMGVAGLEKLRTQLLLAGAAPDLPFALVENGSRARQRVIRGTLATLCDSARHFQVQSPALLILGRVAALAETLHWFGAAPLALPALAEASPPALLQRADNLRVPTLSRAA